MKQQFLLGPQKSARLRPGMSSVSLHGSTNLGSIAAGLPSRWVKHPRLYFILCASRWLITGETRGTEFDSQRFHFNLGVGVDRHAATCSPYSELVKTAWVKVGGPTLNGPVRASHNSVRGPSGKRLVNPNPTTQVEFLSRQARHA